MRYRSILAVLVAAAFLITVVPMTIDGSNAYTMTEGSNSAGYEVKDLSGDDVKMLMPTGWQLLTAKGIIDSILVDHSSNYNITEIVVSDYCYSEYRGEKIEGGDVTTVVSTDASYKISFKATRGSAPASPLLENAEKNQLILEEMGMDNRSCEGAVFTVSATINNVHSLLNRTTYEANDLGFVLTETLMREAISDYTDSDVTYTYNDGTGEKTINFSASLGEKSSVKVKTTYDFRDEAIEHVSDLSKAVVDRDIREYGVHKWDTVRFGDDELGTDTFLIDPQTDPLYVSIAYSYADIYAGNITVGEYHLYGDTGTCIFYPGGQQDPSIDSEAALKEFISAHGSWSENDYKTAQSAADSTYKDVSIMDDLKLAFTIAAVALGITAVILLVLVIAIVIILVKRKK